MEQPATGPQPFEAAPLPELSRKPYATPRLTEYGRLAAVTADSVVSQFT